MYQTPSFKMRAFIDLAVFFQDRPELAGPAASYFRSQDFRTELERIGNDPKARLHLTISLLKHMALDPLVGTRVRDFLDISASPGQLLFVYFRFNRVANPIDHFLVKAGSEEFELLVKAVQENLKSRMFKAARIHRRVDVLRIRICEQISRRANQAYYAVKEEGTRNAPARTSRFGTDPVASKHWHDTQAAADAAFDAAYDAGIQRTHDRVRRIANEAFSPEFRGNGIDILAAFARMYLCPVTVKEAAPV